MQRRYPGALFIGLAACFTGGWLLLTSLGVGLVSLEHIWPVALIILGIGFFVQQGKESRDRGKGFTFIGTLFFLTGLILILFTLEIGIFNLRTISFYWPLIPLILALAFVTVYIVRDEPNPSLLLPAYLLGLIGLITLPITIGVVQSIAFRQTLRLWPLLVILLLLVVFSRPVTSDEA